MAVDDEWFEAPPLESILFDFDGQYYDQQAFDLFIEGVVHDDPKAYEDLIDYMDWMYDIDFEQEFDWDLY